MEASQFKTVKECALSILKKENHLSHQEIADKVKKLMKSDTTAKNIAYYKSKFLNNVESGKKEVANKFIKEKKSLIWEKLKGTIIIADDEGKVANILSDYTTNMVQGHNGIKDAKKRIGGCEYKDCIHRNLHSSSELQKIDACHIIDRKGILKKTIRKNRNGNKYDVYMILKQFIEKHNDAYPSTVRFLCHAHHIGKGGLDKDTDGHKRSETEKIGFINKYLIKAKG